MNLKDILSISGKQGLHKLIAQTKTGALVESLIDGRRYPAFSYDKISSLEDISLFSTETDKLLKEVFQTIYLKENGKPCLSPQSDSREITAYMLEVMPDIDLDRVYVSDMKKVLSWYNILVEKGLLSVPIEEENHSEGETENPQP